MKTIYVNIPTVKRTKIINLQFRLKIVIHVGFQASFFLQYFQFYPIDIIYLKLDFRIYHTKMI